MKHRETRPAHGALGLAMALLALGVGCGDEAVDEPQAQSAQPVTCQETGTTEAVEDERRSHVPEGTAIEYLSNPPAIGDHFPIWLDWGIYEQPIDAGYYVHSMEHGGVTLLYECPEGCPGVSAALEEFARSVPDDDGGAFRFVLMPYAGGMETRVAAVAWGQIYRNDCVNPEELAAFVADHYRKAPEDLPNAGFRPEHDTLQP